jgi:hypothetical protein
MSAPVASKIRNPSSPSSPSMAARAKPPSPAASGADAPLRGNGSEGDANVPGDLPGLPAQVTPAGPRGVRVLAAASSRVSAW